VAESIEFGEIVTEAREMLREHGQFAALVGLAIAGGFSLLDLMSDRAGNFANIVVNVFVQYIVLERLLADRIDRHAASGGRKYGALFGSSLLGTLGIIVGFVCLIGPGVVLMARWSLSSAFVVAEHESSVDALSASWRATQDAKGAVIISQLLILVAGALVIGGAILLGLLTGTEGGLPEILLTNIGVGVLSFAQWLLAAATFRLACPSSAVLAGVFD
jgi:hypothetical protein